MANDKKAPLVSQNENKADQAFNTAADALNQGKAIVQIQTPYQTAVMVQRPRNLSEVSRRCVDEARIAAESCFYGWGDGKDRIEGPSIELAMIAARNWGNCAVITHDPEENAHAYIMSTDVIDLETGFTYRRPFRQAKRSAVHGRMDEIRKDDIRFQIGTSKSQRNAVLRMLPSWLVDRMMDASKSGVRSKIEEKIKTKTLAGVREDVEKTLEGYGVKLDRIEAKYGKKGGWNVEELVIMTADIWALQKNTETAASLFPEPGVKVDKETGEIIEPGTVVQGIDPDKMEDGDPASHQDHKPPTSDGKRELF